MAIIAASTALRVRRMVFGVKRFDVNELSGESGVSADRALGPPRWTLSLSSPDNIADSDMDVWRAMLVQLRGRVNHLSIWDYARPAPRGTMRGTMTLSGSHSIGATTITVFASGQGSATLKAGDWLQIGSGLTGQLVMVMADATASTGTITLTCEHPLRAAYSNGTSVTWDKALGHYKAMSAPSWTRENGLLESGATIDLIEQW